MFQMLLIKVLRLPQRAQCHFPSRWQRRGQRIRQRLEALCGERVRTMFILRGGCLGILIAFPLTEGIQMGQTCLLLFPATRFIPSHLNILIDFTNPFCFLIRQFLRLISCELKCFHFDLKNLLSPRKALTLLSKPLIHVYGKNNRVTGGKIIS